MIFSKDCWLWAPTCRNTHTHLSFVLATLDAPLPWRAAEGLQLLLHDHQPLLDVEQAVVEALVVVDALLALLHLHLQTEGKHQPDKTYLKIHAIHWQHLQQVLLCKKATLHSNSVADAAAVFSGDKFMTEVWSVPKNNEQAVQMFLCTTGPHLMIIFIVY